MATAMDHHYIDQHDIAGRYLRKELPPKERDAFQAHMVDCSECSDRVLLAEMFEAGPEARAEHAERADAVPVPGFLTPEQRLPLRARIVAYLSPWQLVVLLMLAVLIPLATASLLFWWELSHR